MMVRSLLLVGLLCVALVNAGPQGRKTNRIVGGDRARPGQFKYQISLQVQGQSTCGGAIIGDKYILTAAHCVVDAKGRFYQLRYQVVAGVTDLNAERGVRVNVEKVYVLKAYSPLRNINDIAVLKLESSLGLDSNSDLEKIGLPTEDEPSHTGDEAVISGFGLIHIDVRADPFTGEKQEVNGRTDEKMRFAKVEIIGTKECARKNFYQRVVDTHICGQALQRGKKPEGICSGDSGGPLVYGKTVIGVVSTSPLGCVENQFAAVYTRVSSFVDFIKNAMDDNVTSDMRVREIGGGKIGGGQIGGGSSGGHAGFPDLPNWPFGGSNWPFGI